MVPAVSGRDLRPRVLRRALAARRSPEIRLANGLGAVAVAMAACASTEPPRFPLREPVWRDSDVQSVNVACRLEPTEKDPGHVSCTPKSYWSSQIWDGADSVLFRPISEAIGLYLPGPEAVNVNALDEVPDSSWFTNRIGMHAMSVAEVQLGACDPSFILHPEADADGTWIIGEGKTEGSTPGFRVTIAVRKYLFKADDPDQPELASAAQTVGLAIYHAAGFNTTCEQVVYFKPSLLKLMPGLRYQVGDILAEKKDFDRKALDAILGKSPKRGDRVRMQASAWIEGHLLGPFRYEGTRNDDPSDVVAHQDRRDLRASRLVAAWIDHIDAREGNSLDTWVSDSKDSPESSPGRVVHYLLDTSEAFGPKWFAAPVTRRMGYTYVFDWGEFLSDFGTLGVPLRPWDYDQKTPGHELFLYFNAEDFVPDQWKMKYSNSAFSRMTERDGAWMARILARFTPEMVHGLAEMGRFTDPRNTEYLATVLEGRLEGILDRYLTRLSSLADVRTQDRDRLCGLDLAEWRGVRPPERFRYVADSSRSSPLVVEMRGAGQICIRIPHVAPDGVTGDDSRARYLVIRIRDGVSSGPLLAHMYDLGPSRGYRLVGVERTLE